MAHKDEFKHDVVRESIVSAIGFMKINKTAIIRYTTIIVVAALLLIAYNNHNQKNTTFANEEFGKAVNAFIDGNSDLALIDLQSVIDNYSGKPSSLNARLYLIQNEVKNKEYALAEENIEYIIDNSDNPQILSSMWFLKGNIAFVQGDNDNCQKCYEKAIKLQTLSSLADEYRVGLARLFMVQNQLEQAKTLLDEVLENTDIRFNVKNEVEDLLAEVSFRLK
ncbi:MAG: tetratricopeptide repeat protein [Candidatus Marinimicrobia bacterium]|nr:tetratricopeptide repeat protein [Candidatus Neomarinimicrobiota bacterium]